MTKPPPGELKYQNNGKNGLPLLMTVIRIYVASTPENRTNAI
jgi:hypothetical protein